ncbi:MAG: NAD(P)-dependent oxidoreductase [Bacteroidetes bacterium]|nr:MAG: NAD(P)-dependent oxidoreductase [Bacteroidota bacterium]
MILIDTALRKRESDNNPIKVAIIGTGVMGKGIINQITKFSPGIEVIAAFNRTLSKAKEAFEYSGIKDFVIAETNNDYNKARDYKKAVISQNIDVICQGRDIDLIIEVTGTIEFATSTIIKAFENGKHVLSFNAEIDATLGPILKYKAQKAGVMYSVADGDQPSVTLNLFRQVKSMGFTPLLCGNIKGLQDRYRNPTTQKSFAAQWKMTPEMVTSFADGTKISFEQACIANATGLKVAKRGMLGYYTDKHVDEIKDLYDIEQLKRLGGIVDYVVGAKPGPGVFIYATMEDPFCKKYLKYVKMGEGPLYSFYVPYHLLFFEIANSISRMIDFQDDILSPKGGLVVDVVTTAKINLKKGDVIDGIGAYRTYGLCENYEISKKENLLPMGLAEGCIVINDIAKDQVITYNDIHLPEGRLANRLKNEQNKLFK